MLIASSFDEPPAAVAPLLMETESDHQRLARRFWLEDALRGNALAQIALDDAAMELAVASGNAELRVVAGRDLVWSCGSTGYGNCHRLLVTGH